ncbi:hypothetical protein EG68_02136, partial [Paragonimus skrjabini miyazakii]
SLGFLQDRLNLSIFPVSVTILRIKHFSTHDKGIYQCWTTDSSGEWSTAATALGEQVLTEGRIDADSLKSIGVVVRERTNEGLTGHLNCNITFILQNNSQTELNTKRTFEVNWLRKSPTTGMINLYTGDSRVGGIKYLTSQVSHVNQVLSIVNPRRSEDGGIYICRIYDSVSKVLLGEMQFELIIEPNEDDSSVRRVDSPEAILEPSKPIVAEKVTTHSSGLDNPVALLNGPEVQVMKREFAITKPVLNRMAEFSLTLQMTWNMTDQEVEKKVNQYSIEYRRRVDSYPIYRGRRAAQMSSTTSSLVDVTSVNQTVKWTVPVLMNEIVNGRNFCLMGHKYFIPGYVYRVAVNTLIRTGRDQLFKVN